MILPFKWVETIYAVQATATGDTFIWCYKCDWEVQKTFHFAIRQNHPGGHDFPGSHPSLSARFYLSDPAGISATGFNAHWKILDLNRNFPRHLRIPCMISITLFLVSIFCGVLIFIPKLPDPSKYMPSFFIALTLAFVFFMIFSEKAGPCFSVCPGLSGFVHVLYFIVIYIEYLSFDLAYLVASSAIVLMVALYGMICIWKQSYRRFVLAGVMILLYGFIYADDPAAGLGICWWEHIPVRRIGPGDVLFQKDQLERST